jgi:hypothetical protein
LQRRGELLDVQNHDCDSSTDQTFNDKRSNATASAGYNGNFTIPIPALFLRFKTVAVEGEVVKRFVDTFEETKSEKPSQCFDNLRMVYWITESSNAACQACAEIRRAFCEDKEERCCKSRVEGKMRYREGNEVRHTLERD